MCSKEKDLRPRFQLLAVPKTARYSGIFCSHHKRQERIQPKYQGYLLHPQWGNMSSSSMFRVSKFLPSTCKVVQKMRDTGEDIGLYKLQRRTQSRCADPSGRRQTGIQTQCRTEYFAESTRHTFYYALRFSHLISDTNEETVNTYGVLCWGCKSRSKLIYLQLNNWYCIDQYNFCVSIDKYNYPTICLYMYQ